MKTKEEVLKKTEEVFFHIKALSNHISEGFQLLRLLEMGLRESGENEAAKELGRKTQNLMDELR